MMEKLLHALVWGISCVGLLVCPNSVFSQSPDVLVKADTNQIRIGEQFSVDVEVVHDTYVTLNTPIILDSIPPFEVISRSAVDSSQLADGRISEKQSFVLTSFDSGAYNVQLPLVYQAGNQYDTILAEAFSLMVGTVAIDTTQAFKPINDPLGVPVTFKEVFPYLLVILGLLAVGLGIWYFLKKRKKPEVAPRKFEPVIVPHELALKRLSQLEGEKLWQQGEIKAYYVQLSNIVREYLENRFHILALESTTDEIMQQLSYRLNDAKQQEDIRKLLQMSDLAKFAKMIPLASENQSALEEARAFVKDTRQKLEEIENAEQVEV
ncbi:MAG: LPXTG cell wall anchor domain-containing protein [Bacteroidota bacterium]